MESPNSGTRAMLFDSLTTKSELMWTTELKALIVAMVVSAVVTIVWEVWPLTYKEGVLEITGLVFLGAIIGIGLIVRRSRDQPVKTEKGETHVPSS